MDIARKSELVAQRHQRGVHRRKPLVGSVATGKAARLQRLDMGLDLDLGSELLAHRRLKIVRDLVRARQRQAAIDLEIERH